MAWPCPVPISSGQKRQEPGIEIIHTRHNTRSRSPSIHTSLTTRLSRATSIQPRAADSYPAMATPMRKALITAFGDVSNISVVESTIPPPSKNEVQVQVSYAGFSGADVNMRQGP